MKDRSSFYREHKQTNTQIKQKHSRCMATIQMQINRSIIKYIDDTSASKLNSHCRPNPHYIFNHKFVQLSSVLRKFLLTSRGRRCLQKTAVATERRKKLKGGITPTVFSPQEPKQASQPHPLLCGHCSLVAVQTSFISAVNY